MLRWKFKLCLLLLLLGFQTSFSQKYLRVVSTRWGKQRFHDIRLGDQIRYRSTQHKHLQKNKIANLQDSLVIFTNDSLIERGQMDQV